ncbi:phosphate ABC transporter permease subunit PstC [Pleurocapsa sp. PCC 7319]|uniref:phosphate ABC transporter permease subunit PstC n=1 Tax=Pleurocapsa sp. PCC 7319 TaxID=118161 RepID=UPI00034A2739|nr:phosphate ABC transporter permease subunit PstC [Pleurocapsa sp. PCC 7319]
MNKSYEPRIEPRSSIERILDNSFYWIAKILAFAIAGVLVWITIQVAIKAMPAVQQFGLDFLTTSSWNPVNNQYGVWPAIYGTLVSSLIALAISVPIGLGVAIFLSEDYFPPAVQRIIVFLVELLAAVPSVVYGLWGIFVLIPFLKGFTPLRGPGMLPAALVLSVMILPTIAAISRDAVTNVDIGLRQAAVGLGATRWEAILQIILPAASSGIIGGIMLALGRALGETMAVTMLIGNSNKVDPSVFAPSNTVSSLLANQFAEASGLQVAALMYAALILFVITLVVNVLAQLLVTRLQKI